MSINVRTVTETLKKIPLSSWLIGFLVLLIYEALDAALNDILQILFRSQSGTPNWVWLLAGLSVLVNIVFPLSVTFWLLSSMKQTRSWHGDFQQLLIETLRVWGKILLYSLFFVFPGVWKWLSTLFVPYVVLFSKRYQEGEADAIRESAQIFKRVWLSTIFVILIFSVALPIYLGISFDQYRQIWIHPFAALGIGLIDYISLVFSLFLLFNFFKKASREVHHELIF